MVKTEHRNAGREGGREGGGEGANEEGREGGKTEDLLLSGDLMRGAEEEDRRLLMPASGCFRFIVDVERLSTRREEERQTREAGFTLEAGLWGRAFGCKRGSARFCKIVIPLICNG